MRMEKVFDPVTGLMTLVPVVSRAAGEKLEKSFAGGRRHGLLTEGELKAVKDMRRAHLAVVK